MKPTGWLSVALVWLMLSVSPAQAAEFWQQQWSAPSSTQSARLLIRPIESADAERYFHSYMGSQEFLYRQLGWNWPSEKSSLEQNQSMIKLHLKQWQQQSAFTYVVIDREQEMVIGAVYFVPVADQRGVSGVITGTTYNAEVTWWLTEPAVNANLTNDLFNLLTNWLRNSWPWQQVLFPVAKTNQNAIAVLDGSAARYIGENRDTNERFYSYTLARK